MSKSVIAAVAASTDVAGAYTNLQIDWQTPQRGNRRNRHHYADNRHLVHSTLRLEFKRRNVRQSGTHGSLSFGSLVLVFFQFPLGSIGWASASIRFIGRIFQLFSAHSARRRHVTLYSAFSRASSFPPHWAPLESSGRRQAPHFAIAVEAVRFGPHFSPFARERDPRVILHAIHDTLLAHPTVLGDSR